jgi:3-hydroxyisobutyrate dehydrogenase
MFLKKANPLISCEILSVVHLLTVKDTIITMVPETRHVQSIFSETLPTKDKLFIECSTIDPASSVDIGKGVQTKGGVFIDAPVSGGVVGATAGTLTFMVGAENSQVDRIKPVLSMMGARILHCGGPGAGLAGKLANNDLLAISNSASAEAMNLGIKLGLEPKVLAGLINVSTGRCWSSEINNCVPGVVEKAPASRDYEGGFGVTLMKKDLGLAISAAGLVDAKLELSGTAMDVYEKLSRDSEFAGKDFSVVYRSLQR